MLVWGRARLLMLFKAKDVIDALHEEENERLPSNEVANPVK